MGTANISRTCVVTSFGEFNGWCVILSKCNF